MSKRALLDGLSFEAHRIASRPLSPTLKLSLRATFSLLRVVHNIVESGESLKGHVISNDRRGKRRPLLHLRPHIILVFFAPRRHKRAQTCPLTGQ